MNQVEGCFVYDIDDLQQVAAAHLANRGRESAAAEDIVSREVELYLERLQSARRRPRHRRPAKLRRGHPPIRARTHRRPPRRHRRRPHSRPAVRRRRPHPLADRQAPPSPAHRPPQKARRLAAANRIVILTLTLNNVKGKGKDPCICFFCHSAALKNCHSDPERSEGKNPRICFFARHSGLSEVEGQNLRMALLLPGAPFIAVSSR